MQSCKQMFECLLAGGSGWEEQNMVLSFPLQSLKLSVSLKENPDRKALLFQNSSE